MCKERVLKGFAVFFSFFFLLIFLFHSFWPYFRLWSSVNYGILSEDGYRKLESRKDDSLAVLHFYDTYRDSLMGDDLKLYDIILGCVQAYADLESLDMVSVGFPLPDKRRLIRIARMVLYDHPMYGAFWSCGLMINEGNEIGISLRDDPVAVIPDSVYKSLVDRFVSGTTDEARLLSCYLFLWGRIDYDHDIGPYSDCDVGAMQYYTACCQGASFAMSRLLSAAGIQNTVVTCYTASEGYHMVNAVYLDSVKGYVFVDLSAGLSLRKSAALDTMFLMDPAEFRTTIHRGVMFPIGGCLDWEEGGRSLRDVLGSCPAAKPMKNALRLVEK